jgi:hypothetical protein
VQPAGNETSQQPMEVPPATGSEDKVLSYEDEIKHATPNNSLEKSVKLPDAQPVTSLDEQLA